HLFRHIYICNSDLFSPLLLPPLIPTLFPYTTLFRSLARDQVAYDIFRNLRCDLPHRSELQHEGMPIFGWLVFQLLQMKNQPAKEDRKSTRLNSSHVSISYAVFCLKKKNKNNKKIIRY